jgi:hypothetical protein
MTAPVTQQGDGNMRVRFIITMEYTMKDAAKVK